MVIRSVYNLKCLDFYKKRLFKCLDFYKKIMQSIDISEIIAIFANVSFLG